MPNVAVEILNMVLLRLPAVFQITTSEGTVVDSQTKIVALYQGATDANSPTLLVTHKSGAHPMPSVDAPPSTRDRTDPMVPQTLRPPTAEMSFCSGMIAIHLAIKSAVMSAAASNADTLCLKMILLGGIHLRVPVAVLFSQAKHCLILLVRALSPLL